uniref:Uncharacterized protein n=1 Tax=Rhizophora mucronata TaxID=61149 RepID=A0A2P2P8P1_RHIMU
MNGTSGRNDLKGCKTEKSRRNVDGSNSIISSSHKM